MTSSINELIKSRRTIHNFKPDPKPSVDVIKSAIQHAVWAPNHHLTEPWQFHLIGDETKEKICQLNAELIRTKLGDKAAEAKLKRWQALPGWLLLTCPRSDDDLREQEDYAACCCAAQNMSLYLWNEGIGVKWTTGKVIRDERFYQITNIDIASTFIVGLFWYGFADVVPPAKRKPLEEVLFDLP